MASRNTPIRWVVGSRNSGIEYECSYGGGPERPAAFQIGIGTRTRRCGALPRFEQIQQLTGEETRRQKCKSMGMTLSLILLAAQIIFTAVALFRESGEDARFEGDKLIYRS
jgi:hypothetical protein